MEQLESANERSANGIQLVSNGVYRLGTLLFYTSNLLLKKDDVKLKLRYQEALLLRMFVEAEQNFLRRERIILEFWPESAEKKVNCNNRLNMAIGRLRKALRTEPRIMIVCDSKIGYTLFVVDTPRYTSLG